MNYLCMFLAFFLLPVVSFAANVDLTKTELLRKMSKATFKNPEKPLQSLSVSWVDDARYFLKRNGELYRLNIHDRGILIRNNHRFYFNGKETSKTDRPEADLRLLSMIFPVEPFESIFKDDDWLLLPEFAVKKNISYYCLTKKESAKASGYKLFVNPNTFHIDLLSTIYMENEEEGVEAGSSDRYLKNYQWISETVCLPMLFTPEKGEGTPSFVAEIKVNEKIPGFYFDPAYFAPAAKLTLEQLDALRLQNLPGKNLPDGTLSIIVHFGYEEQKNELKYQQKTQSFGEGDFDLCFGIKNLKDFSPAPKIESELVLVNDVWCIQLTTPNRIFIDPANGTVLRVHPYDVMTKANYMYEKRDGKFYPRILVVADEAFHYPALVQWIPDK